MSLTIIPCLRWTLNKLASSVHRMLREVSSSAACQCCSHLQDCIPRGRLSLKTEHLSTSSGTDATDHHEVLWGPSVGTVLIIVRYRLGSHSTTTVITASLVDACTVHGWRAFKCAVDVTWIHCSHLQNTLARIIICMTSNWCSVHSRAAVPAPL
jgi:hypothetical protein